MTILTAKRIGHSEGPADHPTGILGESATQIDRQVVSARTEDRFNSQMADDDCPDR